MISTKAILMPYLQLLLATASLSLCTNITAAVAGFPANIAADRKLPRPKGQEI
ncbi:MAG: hypothetical protein ABTS16_17375 [Candidatus Accumulibacter phosphatis]|uniref:hypothetical protein n=1 Tax=Candidatus Accumulibacter contiguus TaxID=2954381 RepID=UPI00145DFBC5|nr:hypothetical protein [Candidatus Accumulibacter contiguus]